MKVKGLVIYEREVISPEDIAKYKGELLELLKKDYARIISSGKQPGSEPIVPMMFLLGITGKLLLIPNIEEVTSEKQKIAKILRAIIKSYRKEGNPVTYFCHFTEALVLVLKKGTPQWEYYKRTGEIFPGTKKETNFCISEETLTSYKTDMFEINSKTGLEQESLSHKEYGGTFTHLVYQPENAENLGSSVEVIKLDSPK